MRTGSGAPSKRPDRCRACDRLLRAEAAGETYDLIESLWRHGATSGDIAQALGLGPNSDPSSYINAARSAGRHLPYRYTTGKRAGSKFPEQVAA